MRTRLIRRKPPALKPLKRPPAPGTWSVVAIDSEPIRKKARVEYDKVLRGTEKAREEIERFQSVDGPLYSKWLNSTFGAALSAIREAQTALYEAQMLIEQVEAEYFMGGHPNFASAYRKVIWWQEHPEELEKERLKAEEKANKARQRFEEFFGFSPDEADDFDGEDDLPPFPDDPNFQESNYPPGLRLPPKRQENSRLKDLYRNLVRKLHPDMAGKQSARQMEWWHQTQEAYEQGNIEQLELILSLAEMEETGGKEASVSILQLITAKYKQGLNALRRELRRFRKDEAWGFSTLEDLSEIRARTEARLEGDRRRLDELLRRCQETLTAWAAPVEERGVRPKRVKTQRKNPLEPDPWF